MASRDHASWLAQLKAFSNPHDQVLALRQLKNQVIGHIGKKETLVQQGLVDALAEVLAFCIKSPSRHKNQNINGSVHVSAGGTSSPALEEIHYHCLTLLNSLAQGGCALFTPLSHASLEDHLISSASPNENVPRVVSAALKTILSLIEASHCSLSVYSSPISSWRDKWNRAAVAHVFRAILSQTTHSAQVQSQVALVCRILHNTVTCDQHQETFCSGGLLDCIAAHIASYYIHNHPKSAKVFSALLNTLPAPPSARTLPDVLGAANVLIEDSKHRVASLLLSPSLVTILPFYSSQAALESRIHQPSIYGMWDINPSEMVIPWIHNGIQKPDSSFSKAFPALGSAQVERNSTFIDFAESEKPHMVTSAGVDSLLTPWLMHVMRTHKSLPRVRAARLLATIARAGFISRPKSYTIALTVIPLLLDLLKSSATSHNLQSSDRLHDPHSHALEEVPSALAHFLDESPNVSSAVLKAAIEAAIIRETCHYLRKTFEPIDINAPPWSESAEDVPMDQDTGPTGTLGDRGLPPKVVHLFKCRRAGLILLSRIASREDKYRKSIVEHGAMQCIVDSLPLLNTGSLNALRSQGNKQKLDGAVGNPTSVIVAACRATTALARSVLILRTGLVDAAIANPVLALIRHPEAETKVSALAVLCNFLVDSSPMRNDIISSGAIPLLASHARMSEPRIRAGSLWALKNMVTHVGIEVQRDCLDELDLSWLLHLVEGYSLTTSSSRSTSKVSPHLSINAASNAMGERVSIFHTPDDDERMQDGSAQTSPTFGVEEDSTSNDASQPRYQGTDALGKAFDPQHQAYLSSVKAAEEAEKAQQPLKETNQIQGHALDIIRNVLCNPTDHTMIAYVLEGIGEARFYSMLASVMQPPASRGVNDIPIEVLDAALKTLLHVAAGPPHYRGRIIDQSNLLPLLLPLFYHQNSEIRCTCCWILINLMWVDNDTDAPFAKSRSNAVKRMGFDVPLEALTRRLTDGGHEQSHDVRERAETARELMMPPTGGRRTRASEPGGLGSMIGSLRPS